MTLSQSIHKTTVRIESDVVGGGISVGTGFWFLFEMGGGDFFPLLVTNKHVIANSTSIRMRLNITSSTDPQLRFYDIMLNGQDNFIGHPDPDIDLCVFPALQMFLDLKIQGMEVESSFFSDKDFINERPITPVEDVYMTGYPIGLWDTVNNRPITRKGITASSLLEDWQGQPEFMIDMACFGGSSGSPVFIMNEGGFASSGGWSVGNRFIFLGILYKGPTLDVNGDIRIVEVPTATTTVVTSKLMINLGVAIKAEQLNGFRPILGI